MNSTTTIRTVDVDGSTYRAPDFITFTGVDDQTDIGGLVDIAARYTVEWGILFSPSRQGRDQCYPHEATLERVFAVRLGRLALHLCGAHARDMAADRGIIPPVGDWGWHAGRIQVNHPGIDPDRIVDACQQWKNRGIAQHRGETFPDDDRVAWLFDRSGGTGTVPDRWPAHPDGRRLVGYAGGIGPENVKAVIAAINAQGPYWLDMESGVRTGDWFDLGKVRDVCGQVYGAASGLDLNRHADFVREHLGRPLGDVAVFPPRGQGSVRFLKREEALSAPPGKAINYLADHHCHQDPDDVPAAPSDWTGDC